MKESLSQYYEKRTTMAESIKPNDEQVYPVLVFCPDPGFKPSFFKEIKKTGKYTSIEKYLWRFSWHKELLLANVSSIPEVYMNMSFKLGENWNILIGPYSIMDSETK